MGKSDRLHRILDLLARQGESLHVNDLIARLESSPATIRRDLSVLEKDGLVTVSRGRARRTEAKNAAFDVRGVLNGREKKAIGLAAAGLVEEGDSIIIDSGTTTLALACNLLEYRRLSVVTNSIPVAAAFNGTAINTHLCGGTVNDMALVDGDAVAYLASRRVDKAFIGACGVRETEGLTILSSFQHPVKRKMLEVAGQTYALIDSSKFECSGLILFAEFSELSGIVTSAPILNERLLEQLDRHNVRVICAGGDEG